jgi:cell division protein FtsZ
MGIRQVTRRRTRTRIVEESKADEELRSLLEIKKTQIKVVGCGGAGNNTITRLMEVGIIGAQTIAINTDAQDLLYTDADVKILIGKEVTGGLGAGANPMLGMEAARETKDEIKKVMRGADMVFLTCGLGGGTGTGSIPVVADIAKKMGALTVAIVTLPFTMEGKQRMENAKDGLKNLEGVVDTLIVVPNDRLLEIVPDVSVTKPGLVNLDFADVRAIMGDGGLAMIGVGQSDTENRAFEAVERALNNPLISIEIEGAEGALINVTGGSNVTIREAQQIVEAVSNRLSPDAKIIWGAQVSEDLGENVRALLIVTGVKSPQIFGPGKPWSKKSKKEIAQILGVEFLDSE